MHTAMMTMDMDMVTVIEWAWFSSSQRLIVKGGTCSILKDLVSLQIVTLRLFDLPSPLPSKEQLERRIVRCWSSDMLCFSVLPCCP